MDISYRQQQALNHFNSEVGLKFQLYNSLFTSLPFHRIERTGTLLNLLMIDCEEGFSKGLSPTAILDGFFGRHKQFATDEERIDLMFRFVQYAERQVVLFDALEDAAFTKTHDMAGPGTLRDLHSNVQRTNLQMVLKEKLRNFNVRLVLTAHPTQFYPGEVLGIINDLTKAILENNTTQVNTYLQQLGKTPFFKQIKPTPYDEAVSLIWYLENVFYQAGGRIANFVANNFSGEHEKRNALLRMGFWPGGDRDGNPFVRVDTTARVANALRGSILKCYYLDIRKMRRRLTFKGVIQPLAQLEALLYDHVFLPGGQSNLQLSALLNPLEQVLKVLVQQHNGLFRHLVEGLINRIHFFGLNFASLDIRQDSRIQEAIFKEIATKTQLLPEGYINMNWEQKAAALFGIQRADSFAFADDEVMADTLIVPRTIKDIQQWNGEAGCHRYIISQCQSPVNVLEAYAMFLLNGYQPQEITVDIIPLFETIADLQKAREVMDFLYSHPRYREHLERRNNVQTIMLGFSDGTKDGGYLMANWSIYKAKEELTQISRHYDVEVVFFDGRGGPPSRGGGKTHRFYASLGQNIANREIQLTIQGQTVSSNFGTIDAAQYNIEQLIDAGVSNTLFASKLTTLEKEEESLMGELGQLSFEAYRSLREHPNFMDYLVNASPLKFYGATNIGSRPAKRGGSAKLNLGDLRAIPYVGSWSQLKQNVTGYYGVGTAFKHIEETGRWQELESLYRNSIFFKTLMDNCEMSMSKTFFPLTAHLANHPVFGKVWQIIYKEYELTRTMLLKLNGNNVLMQDYPVEQLSIGMRERIVLPLNTIQQYAIGRIRKMDEQLIDSPLKGKFEKLIMRCSFGIINAGRNSA